MAYGSNKKASDLDELTTLASDDLIIVADTDDSSRAKKITKTNLATDLSAVNASETVKGIAEEATDAEVLAGTATGATGAKLFVTPKKLYDNLPNMTGGNLTFSATADENLTIGTPVGVSNNKAGYVAQANRTSVTATTSFTSANSFIQNNSYCQIGTDKFVFIEDQTSDDTLYATVCSINTSTKTITLGTSVAVTADIQGTIRSINKLDTDRFIVFYQEDASTTLIKYRIGTVSTTTITFGAAATFATAASAFSFLASEFLSTEKGVMTYKCATTTNSKVIVFTTSGDIATPGTPASLGTYTAANGSSIIRKIDTDKFIVLVAANDNGFGQVGTCIGTTTITLGTEAEFGTTMNADATFFDACSPTTDTIIIRFRHSAGDTNTDMCAGTISGTTITFGSILLSVFAGAGGGGAIYADSTSSAIISNTGSTDKGSKRVTLSGTTLTNQGIIISSFPVGTSQRLCSIGTYFIGMGISSTTFSVFIEGMSNGFIGIAQSTVSKGATVNILYRGKDSNQNNLIPGAYYLASSGAFSFIASNATVNTIDDCNIVKAITSSQIII